MLLAITITVRDRLIALAPRLPIVVGYEAHLADVGRLLHGDYLQMAGDLSPVELADRFEAHYQDVLCHSGAVRPVNRHGR
jgi:hypothetical protein